MATTFVLTSSVLTILSVGTSATGKSSFASCCSPFVLQSLLGQNSPMPGASTSVVPHLAQSIAVSSGNKVLLTTRSPVGKSFTRSCSCSICSSLSGPSSALYFFSLFHFRLSVAANSIMMANGSNTVTNIIITHRTAFSNRLVSGLSPYINAAMYLIGPTSASTLRTSAAMGARCSLSAVIFCCAVAMSARRRARSFCWALRMLTALSAPFSS